MKKTQKAQSDKIDEVLNKEEKLVSGIDLIISAINDKITNVDSLLDAVKQNVDGVSNKLDTIQTRQEFLVSVVEYTKTGISGLGSLIDNKSKETNARFDEILNISKSTKTVILINIVVSILVLLLIFYK